MRWLGVGILVVFIALSSCHSCPEICQLSGKEFIPEHDYECGGMQCITIGDDEMCHYESDTCHAPDMWKLYYKDCKGWEESYTVNRLYYDAAPQKVKHNHYRLGTCSCSAGEENDE